MTARPVPHLEPPLVAFDANVFDLAAKVGTPAAHGLAALVAERRIRVFVPPGVAAEVAHPNAPSALRDVLSAPPSPVPRLTAAHHLARIRVRAILRGDGRPGKHDADAAHLSAAAEGGCTIFVTGDGKILRKRDILAGTLPPGFAILTPEELLVRFGRANRPVDRTGADRDSGPSRA